MTQVIFNPNKKLVEIAKKYIGVKEFGGDNKGKQVEEFQKAVDGKAQGEAWCMAFVQFCIKAVEKEGQGLIPSEIFRSEHCMTVWNKTPKELRLKEPQVGCLVIWQFANGASGHVGIVTEVTSTGINTIEGNTGNGAGIVREGDGVYARKRTKTGSSSMKVVGFLKVF